MTFRVSKYSFNSWKIYSEDKNIIFLSTNQLTYLSFSAGFLFFATVLSMMLGVNIVKRAVADNILLKEKVKLIIIIKV
jgi:hypothetical protein